jgi:hypothetical protein
MVHWQNSGDPTSGATGTGIALTVDETLYMASFLRKPVVIASKLWWLSCFQSHQQQQVMPMATELLNTHHHQATTPYALKT